MTRKASAIKNLVTVLGDLAINGLPIKTAIQGTNSKITVEEGQKMLQQYQNNIQAHLVDIVEGNEEQAEALLLELGLSWKTGNPNRKPTNEA